MYPHAVYIGRFQPPHAGHVASVQLALEEAQQVLVLLGSANLARSVRQPFTPAEREWLFRRALHEAGADLSRLSFRPLPDYFDPPLWENGVRQVVGGVFGKDARPALVGLEKDISSSYLRWFPDWPRLPVADTGGLNATDIRRALFAGEPLTPELGVSVANLEPLHHFAALPTALRLRREWKALHPPVADPVHEARAFWLEGGHLLLHPRQGDVGQGLWELPLLPLVTDVPSMATFAAAGRSLRGPVVTEVCRVEPANAGLLRIRRGTALTHPRNFFEDHGVIVRKLAGGQGDTL